MQGKISLITFKYMAKQELLLSSAVQFARQVKFFCYRKQVVYSNLSHRLISPPITCDPMHKCSRTLSGIDCMCERRFCLHTCCVVVVTMPCCSR